VASVGEDKNQMDIQTLHADEEKKVGVALIGFGYWGPNLARNAMSCQNLDLVSIYELSEKRREIARKSYPSVGIAESIDEICNDPRINAVMVATPVETHFDITNRLLNANKHVFVEKPLCGNVKDARELIQVAESKGLVIHVDHTFLYTPAVEKIKQYIDSEKLGTLLYFDSTRVNLGLFQNDVDVIWDLAVHDLSILSYVTGRKPISVSATGTSHPRSKQISAAFLTLIYEDLFIAHVDISWMSPVKIRRTIMSGTEKMLVYDDLETTEKLKVYDSGVEFETGPEELHRILVSYRTGDMTSPRLREQEALGLALSDFAEAINYGTPTRSMGIFGLQTVAVLEAASESVKSGGCPIDVKYK
jgi:predicted dehydrogenase